MMKHLNPLVQQLLLVDDDTDACLLFEKAVQKLDGSFAFSSVQSGEALFENLKDLPVPRYLFLDLTLPGMSGMDCLDKLRAEGLLQQCNVIVYSNSVRMSDIGEAYTKGADLFIVKPFSQSHLVNALDHVLRRNWKVEGQKASYFINNQFVPYTGLMTA
jgi:CheY-like chemotaxis protein